METSPATTPPVREKAKQRDATRIKAWQWRPGQSGNPSGKRNDLAAEIARAVFENNAEALYRAFCKTAMKGNAYAFKELADRAYGMLRESRIIDHAPFRGVSTPDLEAHIQELEGKFIASLEARGFVITKPPVLLPPAGDDSKTKPN